MQAAPGAFHPSARITDRLTGMKLSHELMTDYQQRVPFDLFEFTEGWSGKLETQFLAWAAAQEDGFFQEHPGDAAMTERLVKDEEAGEQIADFVNGLDPDDHRVAIDGMLGLLDRAEMSDSDLCATLQALR